MTQFSGYIGNTPVPKGSQIITQGTLPGPSDYVVVPGGYYTGSIKLYIDGIRINSENFTADNGTTVEFDSTLPAETQYIIERINDFEVPNLNSQNISLINTKTYTIRYTSDLWSENHVAIDSITLNDMFHSKFFNGARQHGSGGAWQAINLTATAPDGNNGLNTDGYLYSQKGSYYIKFTLVSPTCSPLQYGKGSPTIKELFQVYGGFHGQLMTLGGFWDIGDQGGGIFMWDSGIGKSQHDGGTVIDPDKLVELHGESAVTTAYLTPASIGTGCWVRIFTGTTSNKWFGRP